MAEKRKLGLTLMYFRFWPEANCRPGVRFRPEADTLFFLT